MTCSPFRPTALLLTLLSLASCGPTPHHRGLAADGYGFTTDSTHLPPPDDLERPAR